MITLDDVVRIAEDTNMTIAEAKSLASRHNSMDEVIPIVDKIRSLQRKLERMKELNDEGFVFPYGVFEFKTIEDEIRKTKTGDNSWG
jgi:hypothetical protein